MVLMNYFWVELEETSAPPQPPLRPVFGYSMAMRLKNKLKRKKILIKKLGTIP